MSSKYQVLEIERVGTRSHRINMYVMTRPENTEHLLEYFTDLINDFAFHHGAHVKGSFDVDLAHFREGAYVNFVVKFWKHPEKHRTLADLMGVKIPRPSNAYTSFSR